MSDELKVDAVVKVNESEALVLNRPLNLVFEKVGNDYIGSDGPFRDLLYFERGGGSFKAFAGRPMSVRMTDGSIQTLKDHWWSGMLKGYASVIHSDVDSLKKCFVFSGGCCIKPEELAKLRSTYTGCVYPYRDYEKVIKFDDMRKDLWKRIFHEERRRKALTRAIKSKHRELLDERSQGDSK